MLCGGKSQARAPTAEEIELLTKVQSGVEARLGKSVTHFEPVLVSTQVVAGTNYFAKVRIDNSEFVHIRVFKPLPHAGNEPQLHGLQVGKSADDALEYVESN